MRRNEIGGPLIGRHALARPAAVVHSVVHARAERILAGRPLGMIGDVVDVGGKERLVRLVDPRRHVRPPEERLHQRRAVVRPHFQLDQSLARMQTDSVHAFHPRHRIVVAKPYGFRSVRVLLDVEIDRQEGGGAMVLRPIEFDSARNPRAGQADQGRLDDRLPVDEIVAVCLVLGQVNPPAEFRQHHHPQKVVFQPDGFPNAADLGLCDPIGERQRIDAAAAPLVDPPLQKHRMFVGRGRQVGRDDLVGDANRDGRTRIENA